MATKRTTRTSAKKSGETAKGTTATAEKAADPAVKPEETATEVGKEALSVIADDIEAQRSKKKAPAPSVVNSPEPAPSPVKAEEKPKIDKPAQPAAPRQGTARQARGADRGNRRTRTERVRYVDETVPRVRREMRRATEDYSYAYCTAPTYIYSDAAQQFFERNFQWTDRSLLVISLVCGAIGGADLARKYTQEAEKLGKNLQANLMKAIEGIKKLMNAREIPEETQVPGYDHKRLYQPAVHSPQAMQFITITGLLDRIVARIEGAWINGVIDADQRSRMIRGWTDECRRYVTSMQELRTRTMQEALNAGKRQEARIIEQRVEKDAANDRMVEKAKVLDTKTGEEIKPEASESAAEEPDKSEAAPVKTEDTPEAKA